MLFQAWMVVRIQPDGLIIGIDGAGRIALERESIALIKPVFCRHLPKRRSTKDDQQNNNNKFSSDIDPILPYSYCFLRST